MSRPRLPVEIVSTSIFSRLPSRIAEPLPNARSIWASAASSAFCRSMPDCCTLGESNPLPMTFNCAAMFPLSPIKSNQKLSMRAADPPVAGGRAPPMTVFVSDLFMENKRGTSAIQRFGERPRKETQKQPTRARTGTVGRSKRFSAPERESSHAHQVRQFQRIEKERVELGLEEQREQVELEQERLQQEEISPAEAARASRCRTCKPAGVCPRAYAYARLSDVSDSRRRACRMEEPLDGSFDAFAQRRGCCRSPRVCTRASVVLPCPPASGRQPQ